ncbi:MAG: aspartate aminotransferase family protein [Candidatus Omnitrophica bacterium]|nr:aspartate aminotransferase family protein [Candidatus Omnitrophota bacterium]
MNTYVRQPLVITKGKGSRVWDVEGQEYLDLFPGWGVSGLGYGHPWVAKALRGQTTRLLHVSNNYYHPYQAKAAKQLVEASFDGKVFFTNSGAEAVETAVKIAHKWGHGHGGRHEIITMERSFHGRTMAALSATGQRKYQEGFEPLVPGFVCVPYNELQAVEQAITPKTAAVLVEPIQGEGGVRVPDDGYLPSLRRLCDERRLLLIADEIQTGMGRTGTMFAYQQAGIEPDVLLLAKTLGGGFPIGAVIAKRNVADVLTPGTHATTYGGSPLGCAAIAAVLEVIKKDKVLERVKRLGAYLFQRLERLKSQVSFIRQVRGRGLMVGIELSIDGRPIVEACRAKRLLINCTQERVLRLLPAMTITKDQLHRALTILEETIRQHTAHSTQQTAQAT